MATKLSTLLGSSFTGTAGPAGTIEIGTVTSNPGATTVTNVGTERSAILNFNIVPGDFDWPSSGIAVSTGSGWNTSLTAPTGSLVGTTDTQTLTNKTIAFADNTLTGVASTNTTQTLTNKTLTNPTISGAITFPNGSTQSVAGATTGKAIAMAIVFGG